MSSKLVQFHSSSAGLYLLCGTYTKGTSKGIQEYLFNPLSGTTRFVRTIVMSNPSYLCISKNQKFVYAVSEDEGKDGTVEAFKFDDHSGALVQIGKRSSGGQSPCYVSVTDDNAALFVANYSTGTVAAYKLDANGAFGNTPATVIHNTGNGPKKDRQESAHAHSAVLSPAQDYLFTADLGTDKEMIYKVNKSAGSGQLIMPSSTPFIQLQPGTGPRHFIFHPNGQYAYLIQELSGEITVFTYRPGQLDSIQTIRLEPEDFKGKLGAADIHMSSDAKFLYASNRGDANDISVFAVGNNGKLNFLDRVPCGGKTPRNFSIDPTGAYLLVANQQSDNIAVFKRDQATGMLGKPLSSITVSQPVCLKFALKQH